MKCPAMVIFRPHGHQALLSFRPAANGGTALYRDGILQGTEGYSACPDLRYFSHGQVFRCRGFATGVRFAHRGDCRGGTRHRQPVSNNRPGLIISRHPKQPHPCRFTVGIIGHATETCRLVSEKPSVHRQSFQRCKIPPEASHTSSVGIEDGSGGKWEYVDDGRGIQVPSRPVVSNCVVSYCPAWTLTLPHSICVMTGTSPAMTHGRAVRHCLGGLVSERLGTSLPAFILRARTARGNEQFRSRRPAFSWRAVAKDRLCWQKQESLQARLAPRYEIWQ